ncbi:MAG: hypothetical protein H0Z31_07490 [Bacillus sp. (in: Bacteria)]|nr:hypothetical protein [Bacillus sp. (in: firmicutes)]
MLIFSKLFTEAKGGEPAGTAKQARPILERSEGSGLLLTRGKRLPQA